MTEDQRTFVKIEKTLATKIKKDKASLEQKLDGFESVGKKEMQQLLDQTVDLDAKTKESQESQNDAAKANASLTKKISETMKQISYWDQMNKDLLRQKAGHQGTAPRRTENANVEEAMRINAGFEEEITSL